MNQSWRLSTKEKKNGALLKIIHKPFVTTISVLISNISFYKEKKSFSKQLGSPTTRPTRRNTNGCLRVTFRKVGVCRGFDTSRMEEIRGLLNKKRRKSGLMKRNRDGNGTKRSFSWEMDRARFETFRGRTYVITFVIIRDPEVRWIIVIWI